MMNYEEFKTTILNEIRKELCANAEITIQSVIKNNDLHLDGLTIHEANTNIAPTIYLNHYYSTLSSGEMTLQEIIQNILTVYKQNRCHANINMTYFTDFNVIKDRICYKLVNTEKNKELLTSIPHVPFLDLSLVFYYLVDSSSTEIATILIQNNHMKWWNTNLDALYELAKENTPKLLPYKLDSMGSILKLLDPKIILDNNADDLFPMYVLTNIKQLHGATCILYPDVLKDFANKINQNLYILPSSVHETLLIPAFDDTDADNLSEMVKEVNSTCLASDELLSEHVYYYNRETDKISCS